MLSCQYDCDFEDNGFWLFFFGIFMVLFLFFELLVIEVEFFVLIPIICICTDSELRNKKTRYKGLYESLNGSKMSRDRFEADSERNKL